MKNAFYMSIVMLSLVIFPTSIFAKSHHKHSMPLAIETNGPMFRGMHKTKNIPVTKHLSSQAIFDVQCGIQMIDARYQNALQIIGNSDLPQELRQLLIKQAEQNRAFSLRLFLEKMQLLAYQTAERAQFNPKIKKKEFPSVQEALKAVDCI